MTLKPLSLRHSTNSLHKLTSKVGTKNDVSKKPALIFNTLRAGIESSPAIAPNSQKKCSNRNHRAVHASKAIRIWKSDPVYANGSTQGQDTRDGVSNERPKGESGKSSTSRSDEKPRTISMLGTAWPKTSSTSSTTTTTPEKNPVIDALPGDVKELPHLQHQLDRVLFNPGIYFLQDPRSRVYNFDPFLQSIMPIDEFDFEALSDYVTSSMDSRLLDMAKSRKSKYVGSTSSLTSVLSHFHFLLSSFKPVETSKMSTAFSSMSREFTGFQKLPATIYLRYRDGVYAVDADKMYDTDTSLSFLGRSLEKLLTVPAKEYELFRKTKSHTITDQMKSYTEYHHYSECGPLLMRSQLDCYDPRLPGTGVFDIKTRATLPIRMDVANAATHGVGYQIKSLHGKFESFEREYYDMIRAAFLKYSLQARIGKMDGIFVAYHNTERIFGFQYISLKEMDEAIHGLGDGSLPQREFQLSVNLMTAVFDRGTKAFGGRSLQIHFETRSKRKPAMLVFIEPFDDDEIDRRQKGPVAKATAKDEEGNVSPKDSMSPSDIQAFLLAQRSSSSISADEIEDEEDGDESEESEVDAAQENEVEQDRSKPILGFEITVSHQINGTNIQSTPNPLHGDQWSINYTLTDIDDPYTQYQKLKRRRQRGYQKGFNTTDDGTIPPFIRQLRVMAEQGRRWMHQQQKDDKGDHVVYGNVTP